MLKKLIKVLLVFAMAFQLVATPLIAIASEGYEAYETDQSELYPNEESPNFYDDESDGGPSNVENDVKEDPTENSADNVSALFYEWTAADWAQWDAFIDNDISPFDGRLTQLEMRARFVIDYLEEDSKADLFRQLINAIQSDYRVPSQDVNDLVAIGTISVTAAIEQRRDLLEVGEALADELEEAISDILTFYEWTEEDHEQWDAFIDNYISPFDGRLNLLEGRARLVIDYLGEDSKADLFRQLIDSIQDDYRTPSQDVNDLVVIEAISVTAAIEQRRDLLEVGEALADELEEAISDILTFYEWTEADWVQWNAFINTYASPFDGRLSLLEGRARFLINYLGEDSSIDLLRQLIDSIQDDYRTPSQNINDRVVIEGISVIEAIAQRRDLLEVGEDLADELQDTIWGHHGERLEATSGTAEMWYLQALELYEAGLTKEEASIQALSEELTGQKFLSSLIAEYRTAVLAMGAVTEVEEGHLVPRSGMDFEVVLDGVNEVVEQFEDLILRFEAVLEMPNNRFHTWNGAASNLPTLQDGDTMIITNLSTGTLNVPRDATIYIIGNSIGTGNPFNEISLSIPEGSVVIWRASRSWSTHASGTFSGLNVSGAGTFEIQSGRIEISAPGSAIGAAVTALDVSGSINLIVGGGTIRATSTATSNLRTNAIRATANVAVVLQAGNVEVSAESSSTGNVVERTTGTNPVLVTGDVTLSGRLWTNLTIEPGGTLRNVAGSSLMGQMIVVSGRLVNHGTLINAGAISGWTEVINHGLIDSTGTMTFTNNTVFTNHGTIMHTNNATNSFQIGGSSMLLFMPGSHSGGNVPTTIGTGLIQFAPPSAPQNLESTLDGADVRLEWESPEANGGRITGYEYSMDNGTTWHAVPNSNATTSSHTITGLSAGTTYQIRIRAVNIEQAANVVG